MVNLDLLQNSCSNSSFEYVKVKAVVDVQDEVEVGFEDRMVEVEIVLLLLEKN